MEKNLLETSIPNEYAIKLKDSMIQWVPEDTPALATSLFSAFAHYLSVKKDKKGSVGLKMTTTKGDFLFGAIATYIPNEEDEDMPGNMDLSMTFYEEEFHPDQELVCTDQTFMNIFLRTGNRMYGMVFNATHYVYDMLVALMLTFRKQLDINARTDEAYSVVMPKCGVMSVTVEGDRKIMTFVPDETLKQIVKDDSNNETI